MASIEREQARRARSQRRILVVDDEVTNRELVSEMLACEGYDVVTAQDGLDVLTQLAVALPDLIVSDLRMPEMSGVEFLSIVRQRHPTIPLVVISGEFEGNEVPPGVPADAYFQKGQHTLTQLRTRILDLLSATSGNLSQAQ
jgi:CheY-like chemotaxis protein